MRVEMRGNNRKAPELVLRDPEFKVFMISYKSKDCKLP